MPSTSETSGPPPSVRSFKDLTIASDKMIAPSADDTTAVRRTAQAFRVLAVLVDGSSASIACHRYAVWAYDFVFDGCATDTS